MTQPCALDEAITGFDTSPSTYGQRKCTTFQNIVKTVLGSSTAPDGQALL